MSFAMINCMEKKQSHTFRNVIFVFVLVIVRGRDQSNATNDVK